MQHQPPAILSLQKSISLLSSIILSCLSCLKGFWEIAHPMSEKMFYLRRKKFQVLYAIGYWQGLLEEHVIDVLTGLSICGNPCFRKTFKHLKQWADLGNLDILDTISNSPTLTLSSSWLRLFLTRPWMSMTSCVWLDLGSRSTRILSRPWLPRRMLAWTVVVTTVPDKKAFEEHCRASGGNNDSRSSGCQNGTSGSNVDKSLPEYRWTVVLSRFNARRVVTIPPTAPSFMMPRMQILAPYSSAPNIHMHENVLS